MSDDQRKQSRHSQDVLDSWKEIAGYLHRNVRSVQRWEKSERLPVHRHLHRERASVYAFKTELDQWLRQRESKSGARSWGWFFGSYFKSLLAALALLAAFGLLIRVIYDLSRDTAPPPPKTVPLTSSKGQERYPAFSPDGSAIAFASSGDSESNLDIYVQSLEEGVPQRLTHSKEVEFGPCWSPEGARLAFFREEEQCISARVIPASGGADREVAKLNAGIWRTDWRLWKSSWTPDGEHLLVADREPMDSNSRIFKVSLRDGTKHAVTSPPPGMSDWSPVLSPDGRTLAFLRGGTRDATDIYLMPIEGKRVKPLTSEGEFITGLDWSTDGNSIVYSTHYASSGSHLMRISVSGGEAYPLQFGQTGWEPSVARKGSRLAYSRGSIDTDIWRIDLAEGSVGERKPRRVIASTVFDSDPQFSPNGEEIVFASHRSGSREIWTCAADGSEPVQLTHLETERTGSPRWSPDGRSVVFDTQVAGNWDLFLVHRGGGKSHRLTSQITSEVRPSWSRDGRWIYYASNQTGHWQIWKISSEGARLQQVTQGGGFEAFEGPEGKFLYYTQIFNSVGIWRMPVAGGKEVEFLPNGEERGWAVVDTGIFYVNKEAGKGPVVEFFDFETRQTEEVTELENTSRLGFSALRDGSAILYGRVEHFAFDIFLVEDFH